MIVGRHRYGMASDTGPYTAALALVRNVARLNLHDQRQSDTSNRLAQLAALGNQNFVRYDYPGISQQTLAVVLRQGDASQMSGKVANEQRIDMRWRWQSEFRPSPRLADSRRGMRQTGEHHAP